MPNAYNTYEVKMKVRRDNLSQIPDYRPLNDKQKKFFGSLLGELKTQINDLEKIVYPTRVHSLFGVFPKKEYEAQRRKLELYQRVYDYIAGEPLLPNLALLQYLLRPLNEPVMKLDDIKRCQRHQKMNMALMLLGAVAMGLLAFISVYSLMVLSGGAGFVLGVALIAVAIVCCLNSDFEPEKNISGYKEIVDLIEKYDQEDEAAEMHSNVGIDGSNDSASSLRRDDFNEPVRERQGDGSNSSASTMTV